MWGLGAIVAVTLALAGTGSALADVTGAADDLRTGWYPDEPSLTPGLLSGGKFKQVFTSQLTGQIYAQPLTADGTLLVATEENWVYGLNPYTGEQRWARQVGTPFNASEIGCTDLEPHVGITGTPVIDTESGVAYFVSDSYIEKTVKSAWYMRAVELKSGDEAPGFPVEIEGTAQNLPGNVTFEAPQELQRPGLLMMNGVVYAGFGSHCDISPYEGWLVGVSTSGHVTTKWATSAHGGSIWQSGGGLISDGPGQILFSTGNDNDIAGEWDPPEGSGEPAPEGRLGESVVRVEVQPEGELKAKDFFSPFNNKELDEGDIDLGSSAPIALPSQYFGTPTVPELLVQDGKQGYAYLLNRKRLGGRGNGTDNVVQKLGPYGGVWDGAAVWPGNGGYVYIPSVSPGGTAGGGSNSLRFFKYGVKAGEPNLSLAATTPNTEAFAFGSGSPIVTSNEAENGTGVLWITRCPNLGCENAELVAYNPVPLVTEEPQVLWKEPIGTATKFSRPDAASGHIYVGNNKGQIIGFSAPTLIPSSTSLDLGTAPTAGQLTGEVTFTNKGAAKLTISTVRSPSAPFGASGLPTVGTVIEPGHAITVDVVFRSSEAGKFTGSLGLSTEGGEANVALSASAAAPPPSEPGAPSESGGIATTASLVATPGPGSLTATVQPLIKLANLQIRSRASKHGSRGRKIVVSYTLSAAGTVEVAVLRRAVSHHCQRRASTCVHWVPTKINLRVTGRAGTNVLTLDLGHIAAGSYRLATTPIAPSGAPGASQYIRFKVLG